MIARLSPHRHCEEFATKLQSNFALMRRSNPDCARGKTLDCFTALAMTECAAPRVRLLRQRLHFLVEIRFPLEADARQVGHGDVAVLDADAVGEAAIGLEQIGVALVAAEAKAGCDVERHLVAAVGDAAA